MSQPTNITELKRFFGIVNFFRKFIPNLADMAEPLHAILKADATWTLDPNQEKAFERIKECLSYPPVLALYDCKKSVYFSADASSYGSMLYQIQDSSKRPITHASKTLSATERGYAQIEKKVLAVVWGCGKFHDYIVGLTANIETDHKPLVPIFMHKALDGLSPRLQRMKLKMMRYLYQVQYIPGKDLVIADALSRNPIKGREVEELTRDYSLYSNGYCHSSSN
ncbi:Retrovirus-related Pol polyprotein from transposon 17.6 [Araneus ventricosus]|uniref:RNA-directed DNA polymerase n=1 Tax=Araneus ventricosus TaxID=182803 RepID=A0A4Y2CZE4_ARAVE|nr:Retrovirus-related Pol polyprotein from transposon 17.6 [Araneus ventricosus]